MLLIAVMVLYDVDKADDNIQHMIKWVMDCYTDICKLVILCEDDIDILEPVKSRCKVLKVDAPVTHEVSTCSFFSTRFLFVPYDISNYVNPHLFSFLYALIV